MRKIYYSVIAFFLLAIISFHITQGSEAMSANTNHDAQTTKPNRLAATYSPYLRQHMYNPVDWYPWGEEALKKARDENKPILISIGYSTCYWCHVLEREVFSEKDTAAFMNKHFVNIKIDREIRPDIDEIYMTATQLLTGRGGWPNNVFLTPKELYPFTAVTYLPKSRWMDMIAQVSTFWKAQPEKAVSVGHRLSYGIQTRLKGGDPLYTNLLPAPYIRKARDMKLMSYDARYGGFGSGVKFPQETGLLFLLHDAGLAQNEESLQKVAFTMDNMLRGGIHDHAGGGFHRYSTEQKWQIPHFEKMLYNQALISVVLTRLYEQTGENRYKNALLRLLDYVARDMTDKNGAFYSAQDAETDAVEGDYYVWTHAALKNILTEKEYKTLTAAYTMTALPHFPGHKYPEGGVLHRKESSKGDLDYAVFDKIWEKLLAVRYERKPPRRDGKILTEWNGMMVYGMAEAARLLRDDHYLRRAEKAAEFLLENLHGKDGKLKRIYMDGAAYQNAFLEDHAWLGRGLMALYRTTGKEQYKNAAVKLTVAADKYFTDSARSGYFMTDDSDVLFVRIKAAEDSGALPTGNAVMAQLFADLYAATGDRKWEEKLSGTVTAFAQDIKKQPYLYGHLLHALSRIRDGEEKWDIAAAVQNGEKESVFATGDSAAKVKTHAAIKRDISSGKRKIVHISIDVEEGWHINANPAGMDFLIPTSVDVQTEEESAASILYPAGKQLETPLGSFSVYEGRVEITASVQAEDEIDEKKMRVLLQVQACTNDGVCLPPGQIAIRPGKDKC